MTTKDSYQCTVWSKPNEEIRTSFFDRGTYANWLHHELERLREKGVEAWVEQNRVQVVLADGYVAEKGEAIALFTTAGHIKPVGEEGQ